MRLIDADALHDALMAKQLWVVRCGDKHNEGYTYDQVHFAIDDAPSIDLVRCKECKHWRYNCEGDFGIEYGDCEQRADVWNDHVPETTGECYCSWGERKESE